ncbi:sugar phosphate isomerase/epimerase family protein [Streptomyces sp. NPDC006529]|uniref:sugar phosphate isomerase/epimerase family protein n=1 Tax=Streptomyces sp. NPDC006529 TaxID=3157177 RepID=UPI0033AE75FB
MKYAFSTLGMPGTPLAEAAALAAAHGYDGVELRAHPEESLHSGSPATDRTAAVRAFAAAGVGILTVAGYARVAAEGPDEPVLDELRGLTALAVDLGAPYVRVFPGGGDREPSAADATAVRRLAAVAPFAEREGVRILLETHDSHRTGADAARVLGRVGHPGAGVLWDVLHTWLGGESPARSARELTGHLGYIQVKDVASAADLTPLSLGCGTLPLAEAVAAAPPGGWLCWEYERRWYPGAQELPGLLTSGREHLAGLVRAARKEAAHAE